MVFLNFFQFTQFEKIEKILSSYHTFEIPFICTFQVRFF